MFNIKGTLYYIYDEDNIEYYLLRRHDRWNSVRIPREVADKYLIRDYIVIKDFYLRSGTKINKGDKLVLCTIDNDSTYIFSLLKTKEDVYVPYDIIQKYLAPVWREKQCIIC